ncbi:hypothetical protein BH11ARM2_BH11ARM2_18820 [soil metagenome]
MANQTVDRTARAQSHRALPSSSRPAVKELLEVSLLGSGGTLLERHPLGALPVVVATAEGAVQISSEIQETDEGLTLRVRAGVCEGRATIALAVSLRSAEWSRDGYVLMPAAVYAGNRFKGGMGEYPPMFEAERPEDGPPIVTDVPRLEMTGNSVVELLAGDMTLPAIGWFSPTDRRARLLLGNDRQGGHPVGYTVREGDGLEVCAIVPGLRSQRYAMVQRNAASPDAPAHLEEGQELVLELSLSDVSAESIHDLFRLFRDRRNGLLPARAAPCSVPLSRCFEILQRKQNAENWDDVDGFYATESDVSGPGGWQTGWVGGGIAGYALQRGGDARSRLRGEREVQFIAERLQASSGFYRGGWRANDWTDDGFDQPHACGWHLLRKSADMMTFLAKRLVFAEFASEEIHAMALASLRKVAEAFCALWRANGQIGQFVDIETGRIVVGGSTSAGIVSAGLALSARLLDEPEYLRCAEAIALRYYERDVCAGITTGGPGEILQCPDSESCFGLLESFVTLWEETGDAIWVERANHLAHQAATWVMGYDFTFPESTLFGRLGMATTGTVFANVQNKHSAPGICTLSASMLLRLWRVTEDVFFLDLAVEITRALPQYLSTEDRPIGPLPPGWMNERVNTSDWELGGIGLGEVFRGSCWPESSLLLSCVELPSIYVHAATRTVRAFDHLLLDSVRWTPLGVEIEVNNPTDFDARGVVASDGLLAHETPFLVEARSRVVLTLEVPSMVASA